MSPNGMYGGSVKLYSADGDAENSYYYWPGTYDTITYQVAFAGNAENISNPAAITIGDSGERVIISLARIGESNAFSGVYTYNDSTFPNEIYIEYDCDSEVLVDTDYLDVQKAKMEQMSTEVEQYEEEFEEAYNELSDEDRAEVSNYISELFDSDISDLGYEIIEDNDNSFIFNDTNNGIQFTTKEWTDTSLTAEDLLADGYEMMPTYSAENRLYYKSKGNKTIYADLSIGLFKSICYSVLEQDKTIATVGAPTDIVILPDNPNIIATNSISLAISWLEGVFNEAQSAFAKCTERARILAADSQKWKAMGDEYSELAAAADRKSNFYRVLGKSLEAVLILVDFAGIVNDYNFFLTANRNHIALENYYEKLKEYKGENQCGEEELEKYRVALDALNHSIIALYSLIYTEVVNTGGKLLSLISLLELGFLGQAIWFAFDVALMYGVDFAKNTVVQRQSEAKHRAEDVYNALLKCTPKPPKQEKPTENQSPRANPVKKRDPSGYVYEAVPSNRLSGVTVTVYYSEYEDGTGAEIWDAEDFDQKNPLITDSQGSYQWFVPDGYWQVKYEKEGYETTYSDWLPVPPPQMDVNIGMTALTAPEISGVKAYSDSVELTFSQYMKIDSVTPANVIISMDGEAIAGTIAPLNAETAENAKTYASLFAFIPDKGIVLNDKVGVRISLVRNYADSFIDDVYDETVDVEKRITSIDCDDTVTVNYGTPAKVKIQLNPQIAAAGKNVLVAVDNTAVLRVDKDILTTNADGSAELMLQAQLPGAATITYTVEGTGITLSTKVNCELNIEDPTPKLERVMSSIPSGSALAKGTKIKLTNSNPNAKIYYTLDMSCPCQVNNPARTLYTEPFTVTENTNLIAYAVLDGYEESNTILFTYTVSADSYILGDTDGNDNIEVTDATFIQRWLAKIDTPYTKAELMRGDVDESGDLELTDVTWLQYYLVNMRTPYQIGIKK